MVNSGAQREPDAAAAGAALVDKPAPRIGRRRDDPLLLRRRCRYAAPRRGVAQAGSAPGLGPGGRRFESCLPDHAASAVIFRHRRHQQRPVRGPWRKREARFLRVCGEACAGVGEGGAGFRGAGGVLARACPAPMPRLVRHALRIAGRKRQLEPKLRTVREQPAARGRVRDALGDVSIRLSPVLAYLMTSGHAREGRTAKSIA